MGLEQNGPQVAAKIQKIGVKPWPNKYNLNDVTATLFLVYFFAAGSWEKDTENGAAVTSLRFILFRDNFRKKLVLVDVIFKLPFCDTL